MKVFIENEAGSNQKNIYNEKTLEYKKTVTMSRKYLYPYGFIIDTTSGDGDNLDVFVITQTELKSGQIIECEPIGLMEQTETTTDSSGKKTIEEDHNILAKLSGEDVIVDDHLKNRFRDLVSHAFDHLSNKKVRVGNFLDKKSALEYIKKCKDK
ncbi:MAG: inorganic diphosphatase [Patescibacteria group bacterium]|nr:inorganic diphosphatase [Patescibacteria group bacterium]